MLDSRRVAVIVLGWACALAGCGGARAAGVESRSAAENAAQPGASASAIRPVDDADRGGREAPNAESDDRPPPSAVNGAQAPTAPNTFGQTPNPGPPPPASSPPAADLPVVDEPIYLPGARSRPKGSAVEASLDDEIVATWNRGGLSAEPTMGPKGKPAHAAPRVKVDVIDVRGDASEADMQRAARLKSYWPFRICYEQGLRRAQKLHGTIKLRLTIGSSGRPSGVQPLATELGDPDVVSCVVKAAMALGLPAPSSGAPQVTLDISLWPGDEPVNVKTAPSGKNPLPADAKTIADQLRAYLSEVQACYATGVARHEGLWGRLALALHIAAGAVDEATEIESHFPDAEVTECVRKAFLHVPVAAADRELTIVYPLRLGHAPDARHERR